MALTLTDRLRYRLILADQLREGLPRGESLTAGPVQLFALAEAIVQGYVTHSAAAAAVATGDAAVIAGVIRDGVAATSIDVVAYTAPVAAIIVAAHAEPRPAIYARAEYPRGGAGVVVARPRSLSSAAALVRASIAVRMDGATSVLQAIPLHRVYANAQSIGIRAGAAASLVGRLAGVALSIPQIRARGQVRAEVHSFASAYARTSIIIAVTDVPALTSGLATWHRPESAGYVDSSLVQTWADSSGNGRTLTQATSSRRPSYKASIRNGRAGLLADGLDDSMAMSSYALPLSSPYTSYMLVWPLAIHDGVIWGTAAGLSGAGGDFIRFRNNGGVFQIRVGSGGAFYDVAAPAPGSPVLIDVSNAATSSAAGTLEVVVNGVTLFSSTVSRSTGTPTNPVSFGVLPGATQCLNGYFFEVFNFTTTLSGGDRAANRAYLRNRYTPY